MAQRPEVAKQWQDFSTAAVPALFGIASMLHTLFAQAGMCHREVRQTFGQSSVSYYA